MGRAEEQTSLVSGKSPSQYEHSRYVCYRRDGLTVLSSPNLPTAIKTSHQPGHNSASREGNRSLSISHHFSSLLSQILKGALCLALNNTTKDVRRKRPTRQLKCGSSPVSLTIIPHILPTCVVLTCFAGARSIFGDLEVDWSSIKGKK